MAIVSSAKCTRPSVAGGGGGGGGYLHVSHRHHLARGTHELCVQIGGKSRIACERVVCRGHLSVGW